MTGKSRLASAEAFATPTSPLATLRILLQAAVSYSLDPMKQLAVALIFAAALPALAVPPVVSNVRSSQRPGTKLVDVYYTDAGFCCPVICTPFDLLAL